MISIVIDSLLLLRIGNDDDDSPSFDIQFIVKCIQDSAVFESLVNVSKVFEKEKLMYETILPALEATSGQTFAPKCFYIQEEGFKLMVFNDLKELGYKMVDRQKGLDFAHCQLLIGRLAAFHASSLVFMRDINLQPMELLGQGMSADPILVECVFKSNLAKLIEVAGEWTGEPGLESIVEHLKRAFVCISIKLTGFQLSRDHNSFSRIITRLSTRCRWPQHRTSSVSSTTGMRGAITLCSPTMQMELLQTLF